MSTDSTELTFIRCPSCRSLVPAVSPRCRMCGATLDAGKSDAANAKGSEAAGSAARRGSNRVRQQTVAVSENEVSAVKDEYAAPEAVTRHSDNDDRQDTMLSDEEGSRSNDAMSYVDPLGAFIEEVPEEPSKSSEPEKSSTSNGSGYGVSDLIEEKKPSKAAPEDSQESKTETQDSQARPRVIIESGQRRSPSHKSALSFGKNRSEAPARETPKAVERTAEPEQSRQDFERPQPAEPAPQRQAYREPAPEAPRPAPVASANPIARLDSESEAPPVRAQTPRPAPQQRGPKPAGETTKGKLYGWLVSYAEDRGVAIELRDGKFFVSRSSLKGTDLILDDDSISTPHALFGVNVNDGLIIQDLMSDRGVFVRRRVGEAYQRVLESTKLEHGDWVRFGDVEFLVALIPLSSGR